MEVSCSDRSSMPTSGGLYYAAAVLAPPGKCLAICMVLDLILTRRIGWGPLAAWVTGELFLCHHGRWIAD